MTLAADQASKAWANARLPAGKEITIVSHWVWFRLAHNSGVTLGLLSGNNLLIGLASLLIVAALALFAIRTGAGGRAGAIALGSVIGGALSNVVDRARFGTVTDFIEIRRWPTDFNLADAAIRLGVLVFLLGLLVTAVRRQRPTAVR